MESKLLFPILLLLIPNLVISIIVWLCYRKASYPASEKYFTFWPRFFASFVDGVILWPVAVIPHFLLLYEIPLFIGYLFRLITSFSWLLYSIWMHSKYGQTVGKMVCKVKVLDSNTESSISSRHAVLRDSVPLLISSIIFLYQTFLVFGKGISIKSLVDIKTIIDGGATYTWLLLGFPMLWFVAEIVTMLTNNKRRAVHDFIAGTVVVRTTIRES